MGNKKTMFNQIAKDKLVTNHSVVKNYSYSKGGITLNFSLNSNSREDLSNFVNLMTTAIHEINEDINKIQ